MPTQMSMHMSIHTYTRVNRHVSITHMLQCHMLSSLKCNPPRCDPARQHSSKRRGFDDTGGHDVWPIYACRTNVCMYGGVGTSFRTFSKEALPPVCASRSDARLCACLCIWHTPSDDTVSAGLRHTKLSTTHDTKLSRHRRRHVHCPGGGVPVLKVTASARRSF